MHGLCFEHSVAVVTYLRALSQRILRKPPGYCKCFSSFIYTVALYAILFVCVIISFEPEINIRTYVRMIVQQTQIMHKKHAHVKARLPAN